MKDFIEVIQPTDAELRKEVDRLINLGYQPVGDVGLAPHDNGIALELWLSQKLIRDVDHD